MKTILVATDFSERSEAAVRRAVMLAKKAGAALRLLHVVDDDQPRRIIDTKSNLASELLDAQSSALEEDSGIACRGKVVSGDPHIGIVDAAKAHSADLIVIGSHRRQTLRDMFVGTTAERTLRSTGCPVLMVNKVPVGPYQQTLIATDFSEVSKRVIASFAALQIDSQTRRSIVHVYDVPALNLTPTSSISDAGNLYYIERAEKKAQCDLQELVNQLDIPIARAIVRYDASIPADEILKVANEFEAELIVLSKSAKSPLVKLFIGSVAKDVLRRSMTDVLTVPAV